MMDSAGMSSADPFQSLPLSDPTRITLHTKISRRLGIPRPRTRRGAGLDRARLLVGYPVRFDSSSPLPHCLTSSILASAAQPWPILGNIALCKEWCNTSRMAQLPLRGSAWQRGKLLVGSRSLPGKWPLPLAIDSPNSASRYMQWSGFSILI